MNLNITELNDMLKNVRRGPRTGGRVSSNTSNAYPGQCSCANRLGPPPSSGEDTAERRVLHGGHYSAFAALGS